MNRKVTRDEVIILMLFKLTWDWPCWFRPAIYPEHPFVGMGSQPTPAGSRESSLWHQGGCRKAWGVPKDLGVTAGASKGFSPWLICCPCSVCDSLAGPAWWHWGIPQPVVIAHIICVHGKWWCGPKCPPNTFSTNENSLFGLKIIPELPGHIEMMVSNSLLPYIYIFFF